MMFMVYVFNIYFIMIAVFMYAIDEVFQVDLLPSPGSSLAI